MSFLRLLHLFTWNVWNFDTDTSSRSHLQDTNDFKILFWHKRNQFGHRLKQVVLPLLWPPSQDCVTWIIFAPRQRKCVPSWKWGIKSRCYTGVKRHRNGFSHVSTCLSIVQQNCGARWMGTFSVKISLLANVTVTKPLATSGATFRSVKSSWPL